MEAKKVSDSKTVQHRIVMPPDINGFAVYLEDGFCHGLMKLPVLRQDGTADGCDDSSN